MPRTNKKKLLLFCLVLVFSLGSLAGILIKTQACDTLSNPDVRLMFAELSVFAVVLFAELFCLRDRTLSVGAFFITVYLFMWMHRIALGILVSGLYILYLVLMGEVFAGCTGAFTKAAEGKTASYGEDITVRLGRDFITGASLQIVLTGMLSLMGIGGIGKIRLQVIITFSAAAVAFILMYRAGRIDLPVVGKRSETELSREKNQKAGMCIALTVIAVMLMLQAGRLNTALDYDSLHYALRSQYVLDNGYGIYENLGSVNDVYVYPKGLETLLLPLSSDVSWGYTTAFSWWMTLGTLVFIYAFAEKKINRRNAVYTAAAAACIPGIMNMACSAKTDAATLTVQMIMLCETERIFERSGQKMDRGSRDTAVLSSGYSVVFFFAAAMLSLTLKPTAVLFTGLMVTVTVICLAAEHRPGIWRKAFGSLIMAIPALIALMLITARTVKLTGYPITSAASFLWKLLGFTQKYPFKAIDATGGGSTLTAGRFLKRLIGLFACPLGEDMAHVYIAWGSLAVGLMAAFILIVLIVRLAEHRKPGVFMMLWTVVLVSVAVSTALLYQVDGNYYMLFYALTVCIFFTDALPSHFFIHAGYSLERDGNSHTDPVQGAVHIMLPALLLSVLMCCITNWAGTKGMTPVSFDHTGFYDHESDRYDRMINTGNAEIYGFLSRDPRNRVLALADQPDCLMFPCNVQSYTDLEGSGGNVAIVKTLDGFKEFLDYAGVGYMYVNDGFIESRSRAYDIVSYMIEDGSLKLLIDGDGNRLYVYISEEK